MASISFGGLASGLDTNTIVSELMRLERQPISRLENDKSFLQTRLTAFSNFDNKLKDLLGAFEKLDTPDELRSYSAKAATEDYFSVAASSTAAPGSYEIEVVNLARVQKDVSSGYTSASSTSFTAGTINISGTDIAITDTDSLADITDKINSANTGDTPTGVSAALINDGTAAGYRIVLTGKDASTAFNATVTGVSAEGTALSFANTQTAQQATVKVDNITMVSDNNTLTGAIPGVTLDLLKTNPVGETTKLNIDVDTEGVKDKLNTFVSAYNDIIKFIDGQKDAGWANDSGMKAVKRNMQDMLVTAVGGTGSYQHLVDVGISTNKEDGTISFDSAKLDDAITNNMVDLEKLFTGETGADGIAKKFIDYFSSMTDSIDGIYASKKKSTDSSIRSIEDNITQMELRLEKREKSIRERFNSLELLMSQMNATSSYLSQQMTMLNSMSMGSK
ncbi:MAG: flagellar filament capping protein FliD [Desulfobulbaceae bacterium]|nr:flagellar filament capping protein FliD [Desulfobulbaceae bacterium]